MPGIVGLITQMPRDWAEAQLSRMVNALRHESFYTLGTWVDESLGVYVGWVARKNSFAERMPLLNENGTACLVFSGEEFPEPDIANRLKQAGHDVPMDGPGYLIHLYEDDPGFIKTLNGQFQGLLTDRAQGTATLFNDRFGMHRFYFHEAKDGFYFAAEAKAILAVRPELRVADPRSLGELASCGCVLENRTLFQGIQLLPAASAWSFRRGTCVRRDTYFQPREWEEQEPLELEEFYQELREALIQNLSRYFNGSERVGLALTGGLDTRVILAWRKAAPGSLPCYTYGGTYRNSQDVVIGRKVAAACGQSYQVVTVGDDFLSNFPRYAERSIFLTDCCVDVSRSSDLYVSEKARDIAPAKVVGTYGSELLRHAIMFKAEEPSPGLFRPDFISSIRRARDTYGELVRDHPLTFVAFRQSPWYHHGILGLEETQLTVRSPYLNNNFVKAAYREPRPPVTCPDMRPRLIAEGNPALARIRSDRGIYPASGGPLAMVTRGYLEFTFKSEYAYDYGMPQWVAKIDHMLAPLKLERLFLGRHKFTHFRVWYRDKLADYLKQMLLDHRTLSRPYLERKGVEAVVSGHLRGDQNYTTEIHRLLTLELFHRTFLDSC